MSKRPKSDNGKGDPVAQAERALADAKSRLAATAEELAVREAEVARLREAVGADPDGRDAETNAMRCVVAESRLGHLRRQQPTQEQAVQAAEAAVTRARQDAAGRQIDGTNGALDALNSQIGAALEALLGLVAQHEQIVAARDQLAREYDLPTPGRQRFLFPRHLLLTPACDVLRARLDVRMATGIKEARPPVALNPFSGAPTAVLPMS